MNSASRLANFAIFAEIANSLRNSLRLRIDCEQVAKMPVLLFCIPLVLSSTASHFLHFSFVFPLIFGLVVG